MGIPQHLCSMGGRASPRLYKDEGEDTAAVSMRDISACVCNMASNAGHLFAASLESGYGVAQTPLSQTPLSGVRCLALVGIMALYAGGAVDVICYTGRHYGSENAEAAETGLRVFLGTDYLAWRSLAFSCSGHTPALA